MSSDKSIVYLNGQYLPLADAKISVLDRGFLFGDGIYEVIPVYGGKLFRLHEHLNRLENSLRKIRLPLFISHSQWEEILLGLICGDNNQSIYLQVTRGVAKRDHSIPSNIEPTIFAQSTPLEPVEIPAGGMRAITLQDIRWTYCDIKSVALLANVLLRHQATEKNCAEAILIRDDHVTEGAASNVFIVKNNALITPPKSKHLLPGITRDLILELAKDSQIPARESDISVAELKLADEIWLTSSTREIIPIVELDGKPIGAGKIGPLWHEMLTIFTDYKYSFQKS